MKKKKLEKKVIEMCWWQEVAIYDHVSAIQTNTPITKIPNYKAWKECFYCDMQKALKCKDYIVRGIGE